MTHVLRAPYSSVINASWTSVITRLEHSLKCLVPNLQMFVTHKAAAPLRAKWASHLWSTLSGKNDEVCPNEEPGSTLATLHKQSKRRNPDTGDQEPSGPGYCTHNTTHRAGAPVNRGQAAQDTVHATQQTTRAHR